MKKMLKIVGWVLLSLIGLVLVALLLLRFCFREQVVGYLSDLQKKEWAGLQAQRVDLLRCAAAYRADTTQYRFAYRQDTVRAREIRDYFRLDTLVDPAASTWDNAVTLARFVAGNIPHNNQQIQPERRNAIALWEYSRTVEPAFNCRLHAIMMHELMLCAGIISRFVTCLPADSLDRDCHVVNIVWLPERQKWAMIDSDMQAWVADPDGTPLSLEEMRRRYIAGEPMDIHPLLDSDNENDFTYYRAYWAKNLYWFECWDSTGYDQEPGNKRDRTVALLSPGFDGFRLSRSDIITSDEARFWAAPENN